MIRREFLSMHANLKIVSTAALCALLAGCSTVSNTASRLWPFGDDEGPQAVASEGERVSILQFEQTVEVASELANRTINLPAPQAVTAWTQPGGTPENLVEHAQAGEGFQVAWRRDIGAGSGTRTQVTSPIVAADGRIYVMDGHNEISAVDAASGSTIWRHSVTNDERDRRSLFSLSFGGGEANQGFGGGLAVAGGRVFVTSGLRVVTALDATTGDVVWTSEVESPIHGAPTVSGNRVYAVDVDNQVIAFDTATGAQAWSYQAIAEPARILRASSPAVTGETVVTPFSSGELIALRSSNGQPLWQQVLSRTNRTNALSEIRDIAGRPVISRGMVYAGSHSGLFAAMDVRSGTPRWQLPIATLNAPWVAGDAVYVTSKAGELIAINRDTGQVYWIHDINENRSRQVGGVFGLFDREVRPIWSGPLLATNRLVLVSSEGEAVALDARTGAEQASINLGGPAYIAPIAYNGMIYVLTDEGQLVAIR